MNAPVILFVYKRLEQTKATIEALKANALASESDLFIYSDGPKTAEDEQQINAMRQYLKSVNGFKSVSVTESPENRGLAESIVSGVTEIVNKYGQVIVLEDDIVTSPYFLQYMNDALATYAGNDQVMSISGYMYPHKKTLPDTFFFNVPLCWGWATWEGAWAKYNDSPDFHINYLDENNKWKDLNKFGGKYLERQLRKNANGTMDTWFIYWHASLLYHNGFTLFPSRTLVDNVGFDSTGEHGASTNKYYSPVSTDPVEVKEQALFENSDAKKIIKNFYLFKANSYVKAIKKRIKKIVRK